jgi:dihydrofolate synthase/folylpolyglutamate synthase
MASDRYHKALKFIYNRQHFGIKLGLHNILRLSEWLDKPQEKYKIVHVAGTNGKGSTASFIASILQAEGYKVGLLTSPHLADYRERIRINGKKISPNAIIRFVEDNRSLILRSQVTFFELTTALAFWYFAYRKVDWAVIETGLGGRLDATNIVNPVVSVITNISREHTNLLGRTIYKIAGEKGGIIKPYVPVVTGIEDNGNAAARRITEICSDRNSPVYFHHPDDFEHDCSNGFNILRINNGPFAGIKARISLAGKHQVVNGLLAGRTAGIIKSRGYRITKSSVCKGLASNFWPGRIMTIRKRPTIIIDVAHNQEGFAVLADTLRQDYPDSKFDFLIGMVEKKKGEKCLRIISPLARSISIAPLRVVRSDNPYHLISELDFADNKIRVFSNAVTACKDLLQNSIPTDILVIAGSHFIMGELAPLIKRDGF